MKFDPQLHHRASTRLKGYDYSLAGAYFITLMTFQREMLFGEILNGEMKLNRRGEIVREQWFTSAKIRKEIRLFPEDFIVMPNHIHGIVWIVNDTAAAPGVRATGQSPLRNNNHPRGPAKKSLSSFVVGFKSAVTKRIQEELNDTSIWQRNYHDHIIRNDRELNRIRRYIQASPRNWAKDDENQMFREMKE